LYRLCFTQWSALLYDDKQTVSFKDFISCVKGGIKLLQKIILSNYRCFSNSELYFKDISVIVGSNNAGKSTIIEALRIIAITSQKLRYSTYHEAPEQLNLPKRILGIAVNIDSLKIDLRTIVHQYQEDIAAEITAIFNNKVRIIVYLTPNIVFATVFHDEKNITRKAEAMKIGDLHLCVMPQIGLIREQETKLTQETIKKDMSSRLSSRHFRNELLMLKEDCFETFRDTAQKTWPNLRINDLCYDIDTENVELYVYDANYAAEIGLMGSGLQMWLQIIWFISRCSEYDTVVLDEPDVYMHPDMQIKILKIVQERFQQVIIATHSVEIISDVDPDKIVTVDRDTRKMRYSTSFKAVQEVIVNLGSSYNLSLARLGIAKKCVFVEGEDIKTLSKLQNILYPKCQQSLEQLPSVALGGWSRFDEALGAARLFYEQTNGEIQTYCILDHDYHTKKEIGKLYRTAKDNYLYLHVWERKELENYIITPVSIFRMTNLGIDEYESFRSELFLELDKLKGQTLGCLLDNMCKNDRSKEASFFLPQAQQLLDKCWNELEGRLSIANGKNIVSLINKWMRQRYKISCSRYQLINRLDFADIADEMKTVINELMK